jgi:hypothetical protein
MAETHAIANSSSTSHFLCVTTKGLFVAANKYILHIVYLEMDLDESHKDDLTKRRFGTLLFMLRMGGIAVDMQPQTTAHIVYNAYLVLSYYLTYFSVFMDYLQKRDNFEESMKSLRMLFAMGFISWIHLSLRYFSLQFVAISQ